MIVDTAADWSLRLRGVRLSGRFPRILPTHLIPQLEHHKYTTAVRRARPKLPPSKISPHVSTVTTEQTPPTSSQSHTAMTQTPGVIFTSLVMARFDSEAENTTMTLLIGWWRWWGERCGRERKTQAVGCRGRSMAEQYTLVSVHFKTAYSVAESSLSMPQKRIWCRGPCARRYLVQWTLRQYPAAYARLVQESWRKNVWEHQLPRHES